MKAFKNAAGTTNTLARNIRFALQATEIPHERIAKELDVTVHTVEAYVDGKCMPSTARLVQLCKLLDVSMDDMFGLTKPAPAPAPAPAPTPAPVKRAASSWPFNLVQEILGEGVGTLPKDNFDGLKMAIKKLSPTQRKVILSIYEEDKSEWEVAEEEGLPRYRVASAHYYGLLKLRRPENSRYVRFGLVGAQTLLRLRRKELELEQELEILRTKREDILAEREDVKSQLKQALSKGLRSKGKKAAAQQKSPAIKIGDFTPRLYNKLQGMGIADRQSLRDAMESGAITLDTPGIGSKSINAIAAYLAG